MSIADDNFHVKVWNGDYGLPSIHQECLAVIAYCKFSGVKLEVVVSGNPMFSPTGDFPVFEHDKVTHTDVREIFNYLRTKNCGSDVQLTTRDSSNIIAYSSMIEEKLLPAVLQVWWGDEKNFVDITRPLYAKASRFPLNFWVPGSMQRAATERIQSRVLGDMTVTELEMRIYKEAKICLDRLSQKLSDQTYFFGKSPSSLDALVFGYLAPLLKLPVTNNDFINHLKGCNNLCTLLAHISQSYFPVPLTPKTPVISTPPEQTQDTEFPHKIRNMIVAGLFAVSVMLSYAFISGVVQISLDDEVDNGEVGSGSGSPGQQQFNHVYKDTWEGET